MRNILSDERCSRRVCVSKVRSVTCMLSTFLSEMRTDDRQHARAHQVANFSLRGEFPVCAVEAVIFFFLSQRKGRALACKVRMLALKVSGGKYLGSVGTFLKLRLLLELLAPLASWGSRWGRHPGRSGEVWLVMPKMLRYHLNQSPFHLLVWYRLWTSAQNKFLKTLPGTTLVLAVWTLYEKRITVVLTR